MIVGDANMCEVATFLKIGTTAIVLKMIEDRVLPDLSIENPVGALHDVSRDVTCAGHGAACGTAGGSAVQLQWEYLDHAKEYVERDDDTAENPEVLARWEHVLSALEADPLSMHRELDWVAKYRLLAAYRERDDLEWNDPKLPGDRPPVPRRPPGTGPVLPAGTPGQGRAVDVRRGDRVRGHGAAGGHPGLVPRPVHLPLPGAIAAASWDSMIFDTGADALQRIPTREPLRGTKEHVEDLLLGVRGRRRADRRLQLLSGPRRGGPARRICGDPRTRRRRAPRAGAETAAAQGRWLGRDGRRRAGQTTDKAAELKDEMDDILDEIDSVLEENAEEFVKSYVQKGGE